MKNLTRGLFMAAVMGVLIANVAVAGPHKIPINLAAAQDVGSTDTLSAADAYGTISITKSSPEGGYFFSVYLVDSVAAAAATDTLVFCLARRPYSGTDLDSAQSTAVTKLPKGWVSVYATALTGVNAGTFPVTKHIPKDSLAVYPLTPGTFTVFVYGGRTTGSHRVDKAYKFMAYLEHEGAN